MNNSGKAVKAMLQKSVILKQQPKDLNLIVIHDDLDLPLGEIKISKNKGSAGHKGVESIIQELSTKNFTRVRVGIKPKVDRAQDTVNLKDFVLKKFSKDEERSIKQAIKKACQTLTADRQTDRHN